VSGRERVLAAMSGGVDSSVAAALLAEAGHDVTGVTLRLGCHEREPGTARSCCTAESAATAAAVARRLGFPHFVLDAEERFAARVVRPFLDEYAAGRTPYPCAECNRHLKFGLLLETLAARGGDAVATGHYARLEHGADGPGLFRARDAAKDQSYALALVPRAALARARFPLGELSKAEVRGHARRLGLESAERPESQDLCFVPDGDYAGFIARRGDARGTAPGPFEDGAGRRLGTHRGLVHYTVGQRHGLGLAAAEPLYVLALDAARNAVVVGPRAALAAGGLVTGPVNWLGEGPTSGGCPPAGTRARVRIRYSHPGAMATLAPRADGGCEVGFDEPQDAVTPGQLAVACDESGRVLGGAVIARALAAAPPAPATPGPSTAAGVAR
jgi:tRNA-specific 2-thiouridylase